MSITTIDEDIVAAIGYCRLGRLRPKDAGAFERAKALGLLAQDSTWRATSRGEGVLIATGLLAGVPAPARRTIAMRWAVCDSYPTPQLVATWTEWAYENIRHDEIEDADRTFRAMGEALDWRFWTTFEHIDLPEVPDHEEAFDVA